MTRRPALPLVLLTLLGCPSQNSTPCTDSSQCTAQQVCRRGACGPICLADGDCGTQQVCRAGVCAGRPECTADTDCASGFACLADRCQCTSDTSCSANQTCQGGACTATTKCTGDVDCAGSGKRCEVTQGLCLPVCQQPQDCAPGLDPNLAFALYTCAQGTCTRRCLNDVTCGGANLICKDGLCAKADCATQTDCAVNQYCTSATFGRCLSYQTCTTGTTCPANSRCEAFAANQCPPGFDCSLSICQELPRCLIDGDCVGLGDGGLVQTGYCSQGHCQPTVGCLGASCATGFECIASVCVPRTCRGLNDCGAARACIDGACVAQPQPDEINLLKLLPLTSRIEVGSTEQLQLVAYMLDGSSYPLSAGTFTATEGAGQPSTKVTVSTSGLLTAVAAGSVQIKAAVSGTAVTSNAVTVELVDAVTAGRRVMVVDAETGAPLGGVKVNGCEVASCTSPTQATTAADGLAPFPSLGTGPATFTAVSQAVRPGDGLPSYERASVLATQAADVYLPLRANPVHQSAGFNAQISFSDVQTSGQYWAGYVATSAGDLPSWDVATLLGENFTVDLAGLNQGVPIPGSVVLFTSPGFGIPQPVKGRSLGLSQAGVPRHAVAFGGRTNLDQVLNLRSTSILSYVGAFDFDVSLNFTVPALPRVPDVTDVDSDGLCTNPTQCPMGSEDVPDYAHFPMLNFTPRREQKRRTEVIVPNLPSTLNQVVVAAVEVSQAGALPTGFASATGGTPGSDGTRAVAPVVLRSGPPFGGLETSTPGVWVLGTSANGTSSSGRVTRGPTLPPRVLVAPFLPVPSNGSYSPVTRTFSPGQPEWSSVFSSGGDLARVAIVGSQNRHVLYGAMMAQQTALVVPATPAGPGLDPTTQANSTLDVVVIDLSAAVSVDELFTLKGPNLTALDQVIDGYSRSTR